MEPLPVRLYPGPWRLAAAALVATSRLSLPFILILVLVSTDPPVGFATLVRLFAALAVLPAFAAILIGRAFETEFEIAKDAVASIRAWSAPLPEPGVTVVTRTSETYLIGTGDPSRVIEALGGSPSTIAEWASARRRPRRPWLALVAKFPLFALLPAVVLFRVHQYISYGGPFGQWQMYGFGAYAATFGAYWTTLTIYLVLYAGTLRLAGETVALVTTSLRPARAQTIRTAVEVSLRVLYFAGVPLLLVLRFVP